MLRVHGGAVVFVTHETGEYRVAGARLMARRARLAVRTRGDWESVTEGPLLPRGVGCAMTPFAGRRESSSKVVRRGRPVVQRSMAADTVARRAEVDVVHMTSGTRRLRMPANERVEGVGGRAAEARVAGPVTHLARRGESRGNVIGCLCGPVILLVARNARRLRHAKRAVLMT